MDWSVAGECPWLVNSAYELHLFLKDQPRLKSIFLFLTKLLLEYSWNKILC